MVTVVVNYACLLGECPVWDHNRRSIVWVDIHKGEIHEYSTTDKQHTIFPVYEPIGSLALSKDNNFIAALKTGFASINRISGEIKRIADPETHYPDNRFNDGKCDPAGRFLAGTMSISKKPHAGSLYSLETDGSVIKRIENLSIPNGMAWSGDQQIFYHIDTPTGEVVSYDYDIRTGNISNKNIVIKIPKEEGHPDGMTIDSEGMLWIAHWNGWKISRWNPGTGQKLFQIPLPVANITSCAFGGDELQDLYITTAKANLTEEELREQPQAGCLLLIKKIGYSGVKAFEYAGS